MKYNLRLVLAISAAIIVLVAVAYLIYRQNLQKKRLVKRWNSLMKLVRKKSKWSEFAVEADKLIVDTLKFKRFKGHNAGEKIVSAQHVFSNNDDVWFCHKLATQVSSEKIPIEDKEVVLRLIHSCRQSLIDLDILRNDKNAR